MSTNEVVHMANVPLDVRVRAALHLKKAKDLMKQASNELMAASSEYTRAKYLMAGYGLDDRASLIFSIANNLLDTWIDKSLV